MLCKSGKVFPCVRTDPVSRNNVRRCESSASLATPLRVHRISVVNSPQSLSVFELISRVFTNSGATQHFC
jgi:hypothetical protein